MRIEIGTLFVAGWMMLAAAVCPAQNPADRITIDELKEKMDRGESLLILDSRQGSAWIGSRVQIRGAWHFTAQDLENGLELLPRNREVIIYCA